MPRTDGRGPRDLRPVRLQTNFLRYPEGSVLITCGETQVICTVSVEETVPPFRLASGGGWLTAEYGMLPRSTHTRNSREKSRTGGRTAEIQRLIGRSLRAITDLDALGPRTVLIDCDVIQADGGTRTASITGAYVALHMAVERLIAENRLEQSPLLDSVAAVSVGVVQGELLLDLCYVEDSAADVDCNIVMTGDGRLIEAQATAEHDPFTREMMDAMLDLAAEGIDRLKGFQREALSGGR